MTLLAEILEQPAVLRDTVAAILPILDAVRPYADQLRAGTLRTILLTGMGASYNVAFPAVTYLIQHGFDARAVESADLLYDLRPLLTESTLLVAISQSGESVEVWRMAQEKLARGPVIGITNTPRSALAEWSDVCLTTQAGYESSVGCKTCTATMAALYLLTCALTGESLDQAADAIRAAADQIEQNLNPWTKQMQSLAATLPDDGLCVFLGRAASESSARSSALALNESAKVFTAGMTGSMFRHGPVEVLDERTVVFSFAGSGPTRAINQQLAEYLVGLQGRVIVVGTPGTQVAGASFIRIETDDPWTLPIIEIVPIQLLAVALCERRGIVPGTFRYLRKVATHE